MSKQISYDNKSSSSAPVITVNSGAEAGELAAILALNGCSGSVIHVSGHNEEFFQSIKTLLIFELNRFDYTIDKKISHFSSLLNKDEEHEGDENKLEEKRDDFRIRCYKNACYLKKLMKGIYNVVNNMTCFDNRVLKMFKDSFLEIYLSEEFGDLDIYNFKFSLDSIIDTIKI